MNNSYSHNNYATTFVVVTIIITILPVLLFKVIKLYEADGPSPIAKAAD